MNGVTDFAGCAEPAADHRALSVLDVYNEHGEFIWKTLHRLGVREGHTEDVFQEVLVVVSRRLPSFDRRSALTTWLFGVCFRVASVYRKRAHRRRELPVVDAGISVAAPDLSPEQELERREAASQLLEILDMLTLEQRAVFVMFEVEGLKCQDIATMLGVPLGTVHSRLHWARQSFAAALHRRTRSAERGRP